MGRILYGISTIEECNKREEEIYKAKREYLDDLEKKSSMRRKLKMTIPVEPNTKGGMRKADGMYSQIREFAPERKVFGDYYHIGLVFKFKKDNEDAFKRRDLDNMIKLCVDAMKYYFFIGDDNRVISIYAQKEMCRDSGIEISINALTNRQEWEEYYGNSANRAKRNV